LHRNEFGLIEFNFDRCDFGVPYQDYITLFGGTFKRIFWEASLTAIPITWPVGNESGKRVAWTPIV
jgi:hypothetical protein